MPQARLFHPASPSPLAVALAAGVLATLAPCVQATSSYTLTDIGVLPGYDSTYLDSPGGQVLNNNGQVIAICTRVLTPVNCGASDAGSNQQVPVRYTPGVGLIDLSGGASENHIVPEDINASGQVFGQALNIHRTVDASCNLHTTQSDSRLWLYTDGTGPATLPVPSSVADHYTIAAQVGRLTDAGIPAISWADFSAGLNLGGGRYLPSGYQEVSSLDPSLTATKTGIVQMNNTGQFCGTVIGPSGFSFRYTDGVGLQVVPDLGLAHTMGARCIDAAGDLAGVYRTTGSALQHAWLMRSGQAPVDIHNTALASQSDVNLFNSSYVAGPLETSTGGTAGVYRWDQTNGMVSIPVDPFYLSVAVRAMNNQGAVVGDLQTDIDFAKPWIWTPSTGLVYLRDAIGDPDETQWRLLSALAINDHGQIVVYGENIAQNRSAVFLLTPTTTCRADFNNDNAVNVSDIFAFLRAWFAHSPSADINGDTAVNVSDIFAFLRAWFARCN